MNAALDRWIPVDGRADLVLRGLLTAIMVVIGLAHFIVPNDFVKVMPPYLPAPYALVLISGLFEVLGGVGLWVPATRRFSAFGLIALYIAVFPANVHMAMNHVSPGGIEQPAWALWARLPFQAVFMGWAWLSTRRK